MTVTAPDDTAPVESPIALCRRCRRRVLPRTAQPSWHKEVHRAAADGMVDAATETRVARAKRRNVKKRRRELELRALRTARRAGDMVAAAKLFLDTRTVSFAESRQVVEAERDCPDCLKLQMKQRDRANRVAGMVA